MSANNYQFIDTLNFFRDHFAGHPYENDFGNLPYEVWNQTDSEDKAALLYVVFSTEILQAWDDAVVSLGVVHISQDDGVSTVLQYLMKNVPLISNDEKRYASKYIYRVCSNCLLNLWGTRGTDMKRSANEISNEYKDGDVEVNLWDLVPSYDVDPETQQIYDAIWNIVHHMGPKAEKVVNHLINPDETIHKICEKSSERPIDRLADVSVSKVEYEEIVEELKVRLAPYKDYIFNF